MKRVATPNEDAEAAHGATTCLNCGRVPTIRAHLIPQAFAREVRQGDKQLALTTGGGGFQISQNGRFDTSILCHACDKVIGAHEGYAVEVFRTAREATAQRQDSRFVEAEADQLGDRLIRFAAGVTWKFSVTRPEYGRINVGPYQDVLRAVAFENCPIPPQVDMLMVRLKARRFEETFFRSPRPDKKFGVNFIRLTMGAFLMLLKIDRRPVPKQWPAETWLRGRSTIVFPVMPLSVFEEGRTVTLDWAKNPKLARWHLKPVIEAIEKMEGRKIPMDEVRIKLVPEGECD